MRPIMDCRYRFIRVGAWLMGRVVRVYRGIKAGLWGIWATFGGANFLMNAMATLVAVCCCVLVWWAVFEDVVPMHDSEVIMVVPGDRIIDRDTNDDFTVTRRVCMRRSAWGTVSRQFVGEGSAGLEYRMVPTPPIYLQKGCHERSRTIDIPLNLPPGQYTYRSRIEFCNKIRCEEAWVQDVPLSIRGAWPPPQPHNAPGPIKEAL